MINVSEVAVALEKWAEQGRTVRAHGEDYTLPAVFNVTAFRRLMICKREQFDVMESGGEGEQRRTGV